MLANAIASCNHNQGFMFVVLTFVYVIATVAMMRAMRQSNVLARESLKQAMALDRARSRPHVIFMLEFGKTHSSMVDAVLTNIGQTAAYNVKVSLAPTLLNLWSDPAETRLTTHPIRFLPPGHSEVDALGTIARFHQQYPDPAFEGEVVYEDAQGHRYAEPVTFDFNYRKVVGRLRFPNVGSELEKLNGQVKALTEAVGKIGKRR